MADTPGSAPTPSLETPSGAPSAPETSAGISAPAKAPEAQKERMYNVKIDGKEEQWPESKVLERAQKGAVAERMMDQASRYEQAFANFVSQSKDPAKLLDLLSNPKALGYSDENKVTLLKTMLASKNPAMVQAVKQWLYENEVEPATLTPEQRELRELKGFKTQAEKERAEREQAEKEAKFQKDTEEHLKEYKMKIWEGIQAHKLPQTELMVSRVARKIQLMRKAGMAADFGKACGFVKQDLINEYNEHLGKATDQDILNLLPEGVAERINKAWLAKLKGPEQEKIQGNPAQKKQKREKDSKENLAHQLRQMERGQKIW